MTASAKLDAIDQREAIFAASYYRCEACGGPVRAHGTAQLAHRISKSVGHLRDYGPRVIHHRLNLAPVCSLRCNSAVLIDGNPVEKEALLDRIFAAIDKEENNHA